MWISLVIVLAVCALVSVARRWAPRKAPPEYPGALPIIGHGHLFASLPLYKIIRNIATTSLDWGGIVSFQMGLKQAYMLSDPEDSLTIINACHEKDFVYDFIKPFLGEGLLTGKEATWKGHRKLLSPAFNQAILDGFMGVFNSQAGRLVARLDKHAGGKPFDCHEHLDFISLETICLTAMGGAPVKELLNDEYLTAREKTQEIIIKRFQRFWLHTDFMFNLSLLKKPYMEGVKIMQNGSKAVIQKNRDELRGGSTIVNEKSGAKFKTFIDQIMKPYGEKDVMTDQEIREEVDTMIVAGHETTALTLLFTLLVLGSHPDVQDKAFQEISEVVGDRDVEKQDLSKLVYLEATLKEAMRLYPIAPVVGRKLTENVKTKNYTLPAGSSVYISMWALHRSAAWGADAAAFAPARWLDKRRIPPHAAAYAPFSMGKRNCLGKTYAMMAMKTTLVHIVRNFRITSDSSKLKLKQDVMLKPISGHKISVERRK